MIVNTMTIEDTKTNTQCLLHLHLQVLPAVPDLVLVLVDPEVDIKKGFYFVLEYACVQACEQNEIVLLSFNIHFAGLPH